MGLGERDGERGGGDRTEFIPAGAVGSYEGQGMKTFFRNVIGALVMAATVTATTASPAAAQGKKPEARKPEAGKPDSAATQDALILRSGKRVDGKIQKETETQIEFLIITAPGLSAMRTYEKSEVLDIIRDIPVDAPKGKDPSSGLKVKQGTTVGAGGTKIYMLELTGEFQRDISITPMKDVVADIKKVMPNVLVIKINCEFTSRYGEKIEEFMNDKGSFDQLELVRQIEVLFTDQIDHDSSWTTKPRLVFWVDKAMGGIAFLPFVGKEIYYTSRAKHGGIGWLDLLFDGVGDEVVREKQRSLREGRAEGLAVKGGHPVEILRAMARIDYVLSVSYVGGKPVFHEDETGEFLLTDDGSKEAGRRDTVEDVLRGRGNDVLTLDAETAKKVGMSLGTIDDEQELAFALGYERDYTLLRGKSKDILGDWSKGVRDAEVQIRKLARDYLRVEPKDASVWEDRRNARSQRIKLLETVNALIARYGESINPREIRVMPETLAQDNRIAIEQIRQAQRLDKR